MTLSRRAFLGRMLLMPLGAVSGQAAQDNKRAVHLKNVYIAGTQFHEVSESADLAALAAGDDLELRREPDNPHDEYAVAVYTRAQRKLGFIPRHQNRTIARIMDQGVPVTATIDKVAPDVSPWRRIWINVQEQV